MRSAKAAQSPVGSIDGDALPCAGGSYLERLGIVYMDQIRLTIVTELYLREMGVRQFYETIGGSSYDSVRRHFFKLVEFGWLRYVRTGGSGRGRPEKLYRATELAVIDTETWRDLPFSIRDAFTVQLLEEMAGRVGEALKQRPSSPISTFKTFNVDEPAWYAAYAAVERCFHTILRKQADAKIRMEGSDEKPRLMLVNLAAFEAPRPLGDTGGGGPLPKARPDGSTPWPQRVGKVFADRLDFLILNELNRDTKTPAELRTALGGASSDTFLRRCKKLADLGWAVCTDTLTGGNLYGANVSHFRAAAPDISEADLYRRIPRAARSGPIWDTFQSFIETSIAAVDAGTFNNRTDRHLTMSPLLLDDCGCGQVAQALRIFERDVLRLDQESAARRRGRKNCKTFPAAFLASGVETSERENRR